MNRSVRHIMFDQGVSYYTYTTSPPKPLQDMGPTVISSDEETVGPNPTPTVMPTAGPFLDMNTIMHALLEAQKSFGRTLEHMHELDESKTK